MRVGFYTVLPASGDRTHYRLAEHLIRSVRKCMADVQVIQFTDLESPDVEGANGRIRIPLTNYALHRCALYGSVTGEWLFVDTDVVLRESVSHVFDQPFDIALTDREWPHLAPTPGLTRRMPFNAGVIFSRSAAFWQDVCSLLREPSHRKPHMADQWAIGQVAQRDTYRVVTLPGVRYNFPPAVSGDNYQLSSELRLRAAIVHYKGPKRKKLLLREVAA